jgi:hypothetical protein
MSNIQYSISNIQVGEEEHQIFAQRRGGAEELGLGNGLGRMPGGEMNGIEIEGRARLPRDASGQPPKGERSMKSKKNIARTKTAKSGEADAKTGEVVRIAPGITMEVISEGATSPLSIVEGLLQSLKSLDNAIEESENEDASETARRGSTKKYKPKSFALDPKSYPFTKLIDRADRYLELGPEEYRKQDKYGMPPEEWTEEQLASVRCGMEQISRCCGLSRLEPVCDIGVDGFNRTLETLHFELQRKVIARKTQDAILYEMRMASKDNGKKIALYNSVAPAISTRRPRKKRAGGAKV